jgi:SP family facilitated glucose transporter-like MFS transporter 3
MALTPNIWVLIPARLITGFAAGLSTVVVPVYLGEIAPPTLRGALGAPADR